MHPYKQNIQTIIKNKQNLILLGGKKNKKNSFTFTFVKREKINKIGKGTTKTIGEMS